MGILDALNDRAERLRLLNAVVLRDGNEIERSDYDEVIRRNLYSATKSFTSAAVGLAEKEGLLSLDEKVADVFPEDLPASPSGALLSLTVADLLTMRVGQDRPVLMGPVRHRLKERNWVAYALSQPFECRPGERFKYSNTGPYLAGVLVQQRSGCSLPDYMFPRLFNHLGIKKPTWETDPMGNSFGAGGLFLSVDEFAAFGQLYLQNGCWKGKQILSADWIARSTAKHADTPKNDYGYGYLFWRDKDCYFASGKYGQYTIVVPGKNAVIAVMAENHEDTVLQAILEVVLPRL